MNGVYQITGISQCRTTASCSGTADETKSTIGYDSNGNPTSVTVAAGDGSVSATTASTYDGRGNRLTVDGPLAGAGDTTTYRYDADNRLVGVISPDPDGAGPLVRKAVRMTYSTAGDLTLTELGTVNGTADTDWSAFVVSGQAATAYDANHRKQNDSTSAGGTTYSLTQYSYDVLGRLQCAGTRMNSAIFGSLPASACTLGTQGSLGPDQIAMDSYDPASQLTGVTTGYGTGAASSETIGYSNNGLAAYVVDANSNRTSYIYDGFDRLSQTQFPSPTKGANTSNSADYEQLTYDANSNVLQRRRRDGTLLVMTYDNLARLATLLHNDNNSSVTYSYNLLNNPTQLARTDGVTLTNAYDALGRLISESQPSGSMSYQYDAAGEPIRLTWADGFYANYVLCQLRL